MVEDALTYARQQRQAHLAALSDLLRIPSISTFPDHASDVQRAAAWLADCMHEMGFPDVEVISTPGHPVVYGEWQGGERHTLLAYAHYDVQPVDPLDQWHSRPFEPTIRGDDLFCRGASDDKGQLLAVLVAAEAYLHTAGRLPLNLKVLLEGEEEISSPHMPEFLRTHQDRLRADAVLVCDASMLTPQIPLIMYGLRGLTYLEVEVRGPATDLHSGTFGGAVDNPLNVLVRLLASLHDPQSGRIALPGLYDAVRPLGDEERSLLAQIPMNDDIARQMAGVPALGGEPEYALLERVGARPALDIHGIWGGFTGPGAKTVIPARALAKLSVRLVPDQEPLAIAHLLEEHLRSLTPASVHLEVRLLGTARPVLVDYQAFPVQAMAKAFERVFGTPPGWLRGGGSVGVVAEFQSVLGVPVVLTGFGLPDDNTHAPNEKLHLPNFYRGIESLIHYCSILGQGEG